VHPEDFPAVQAAVDRAHDPEGDGNYYAEYRVIHRSDAQTRWIAATGKTFFHEGRPVRLVGTVQDVTERKKADANQQFLVQELAHRMKNQLAIVQAMAGQTARSASTLEDFQKQFARRLLGLAIGTDVLIEGGWNGSRLEEIVKRQLEPINPGPERLMCSGPVVWISIDATQAISLALHELATNSVKYGAWSVAAGTVAVSWQIATAWVGKPCLRLIWVERGGPPVAPSKHRGFGHIVIESMTAQKVDGQAQLIFAPEGVSWTLIVPPAHYRAM
jgi:two-component sensor histidine kinase